MKATLKEDWSSLLCTSILKRKKKEHKDLIRFRISNLYSPSTKVFECPKFTKVFPLPNESKLAHLQINQN